MTTTRTAATSETKLEIPSDTEIVITRTLNAPPELVWAAWTDPSRLARWFGPSGFVTRTERMDVKPGGQWKFTMRGPDGRDYSNLITYLEVRKPSRIVYEHGGADDVEPVHFETIATFEPVGKGTLVTLRMSFVSKEARDFTIREYGADEGGKQTITRLAELCEAEARGDGAAGAPEAFEITRVFRAPRDLVWKAWTSRDHLVRWFGPAGVEVTGCTLDLRVGGMCHFGMKARDIPEYWGLFVYREVTPTTRLVWVHSFADASGKPVSSPFGSPWPLEILSTVTFADHAGIGRGTVMTIHWEPLNATDAERRAFAAGHASMRGGWGSTLDKLEQHLG